MNEYIQVLQKYAVFSGRAPRREYWMFFLFNILIGIGLGLIFGVIKGVTHINLHWLASLYSLGILCPGIAVAVRRLHDTNRSGFWLFLSLIPIIGGIILLVFMCQKGADEDNKF